MGISLWKNDNGKWYHRRIYYRNNKREDYKKCDLQEWECTYKHIDPGKQDGSSIEEITEQEAFIEIL